MARFDRGGPIAVVAASEQGAGLASLIAGQVSSRTGCEVDVYRPDSRLAQSITDLVGALWKTHTAIVGVMAVGIMVRAVAPWLTSKHSDPAVVVVDDAGRFSVSLVSGHEGGANQLAALVAEITHGTAVVTTASEASKRLVVGVGTRRGVSESVVLAAIEKAVTEVGMSLADIQALSTLEIKASEEGIRRAALILGVPLTTISQARVKALQDALREENFVEAKVGVAGVCVPAALLGRPDRVLAGPKVAENGVTVAAAVDVCGWLESALGAGSTSPTQPNVR